MNERMVILTFDDAVKSHLTNVAPLLKELGFGATFFICRFNDDWRAQNGASLLDVNEIRELADMGFEIGNHTFNHPDLRTRSDAECEKELVSLNEYLATGGIDAPVSFAYPGGPYAENAVETLKQNGLKLARTTERRAWDIKNDDPYRVPSIPLQKDDEQAFHEALALCDEGRAVVLTYHGIPDTVHEFVSTSLPFFTECMHYLRDNGYVVRNLGSCLAQI